MSSVVQYIAVKYRALHCTALHCTALNCTKLHCTALGSFFSLAIKYTITNIEERGTYRKIFKDPINIIFVKNPVTKYINF